MMQRSPDRHAHLVRHGLGELGAQNPIAASPAQRTILAVHREIQAERLGAIAHRLEARMHPSDNAPRSGAVSAVLIKPVGDRCNLRCTYCYEGIGSDRKPGLLLSEALLERIVRQVIEVGGHSVEFVWHGGEPLLAGLPFFERAVELQARLRQSGQMIRNSIQTNATRLNSAWAQFFARHGFTVGVSVDAPPDLHDRSRVDARGDGTFARVERGLDILRAHRIPHGAILVAGEAHVGRQGDILASMEALGLDSFDLHPSCGNGRNDAFDISPASFAKLCIALFDLWIERPAYVAIPTFTDILRYLTGQSPTTCYFAGRCTSIVAIEANGDVVPCTRPFDRHWVFGTVAAQSLRDILSGDRHQEFVRRDMLAQSSTSSCRWFGLCHNGCPQHRQHEGSATIDGRGIFCDCSSPTPSGWPALFDHIERRVLAELGVPGGRHSERQYGRELPETNRHKLSDIAFRT